MAKLILHRVLGEIQSCGREPVQFTILNPTIFLFPLTSGIRGVRLSTRRTKGSCSGDLILSLFDAMMVHVFTAVPGNINLEPVAVPVRLEHGHELDC